MKFPKIRVVKNAVTAAAMARKVTYRKTLNPMNCPLR
jgi:hypothetical protein